MKLNPTAFEMRQVKVYTSGGHILYGRVLDLNGVMILKPYKGENIYVNIDNVDAITCLDEIKSY